MANISITNNTGGIKVFFASTTDYVTLNIGYNPEIDSDLWDRIVSNSKDILQPLLDSKLIIVDKPESESATVEPTKTRTVQQTKSTES
jgi:hypothetical protein